MFFSGQYMRQEKFSARFHGLVFLFIGSMLLLIFSPHLVFLLLGWDGLGVTSFLLVIYFQRSKSSNAGMLTVLTNRLGDLGILIAIALSLNFGNWNLFLLASADPKNFSGLAAFTLVVFAACTKRAQIPFSAWLPAAMAAPTPVSALVHSSTLVTAGVYLLVRLQGALSNTLGLQSLLILGLATMLMARLRAMYEIDLKKIIALSTLSQLGLMVSSAALGAWNLAFIHLLSHAYFKALLFITVGHMIHLREDFQDIRKASLTPEAKTSITVSTIANLSLCGLPFLSGFFSKDLILENLLSTSHERWGYVVAFGATLLTAAYTARLIVFTWWGTARLRTLGFTSDSVMRLQGSYLPMSLLALAGGRALVWFFIPRLGLPVVSFGGKTTTAAVISLGALAGGALSMQHLRHLPTASFSWGSIWALPSFSFIPRLRTLSHSASLRSIDLSWHPQITWDFVLTSKWSADLRGSTQSKFPSSIWWGIMVMTIACIVY